MVVPDETRSPTDTSTGTDSPVSIEVSTDKLPLLTIPSTGMVSPGAILTMSPSFTLSIGTMPVSALETTRASFGVRFSSFISWALALPTVAFSRNAPICMMTEISAAASYSPMRFAATIAIATRTSAVMSWSSRTPRIAPNMIGVPQMRIAT